MRPRRNFDGQRWSSAEDEAIRRLFPDVAALSSLLPHRTIRGIRQRAHGVGMRRERRRPWTMLEQKRLAKMWPTATPAEIAQAFPDRTWKALESKAFWLRSYKVAVRGLGAKPTLRRAS